MEHALTKGLDYTGISVVFFCHDGVGNFLMAKRSANTRDEHGRWDTGGGGVEFGHTIEDTLYKEICEEYCADVLEYQFLGYRDVHREHNGLPTHWIALDFKVLVDRNQVRNGEPHMIDEIGWFTLDTLPDNTHSQLSDFLKRYNRQLRDDEYKKLT